LARGELGKFARHLDKHTEKSWEEAKMLGETMVGEIICGELTGEAGGKFEVADRGEFG
jgi:hypothetical protein